MIILQGLNLSQSFNGIDVFNNVSVEIQSNSRIGLVGPNGAGKTTLLNLLLQKTTPTSGTISITKGTTYSSIAQENNLNIQNTIYDEMLIPFKDNLSLIDQQKKLEQKISLHPEDTDLVQKYAGLQAQFEALGGYTFQSELKSILNGFNFPEETFDKRISNLSGGEKTRLSFAKLILEKPDILFLDEPTNHLDLNTLDWLEGYLKSYPGAIFTISHDQYFLDNTTTEIYELTNGSIQKFTGNYSTYREIKAQNNATLSKEYDKQQKEIKRQEEFVQKNIVRASSTKQAQSRRKMLEKMDRIELPDSEKSIKLQFEIEKRSGNEVLSTSNLTVGYNGIPLINNITFEQRFKDRIGILGPNGTGKSTPLKTLLKKIPAISGTFKFGASLTIGYYDQDIAQLDPKKTVIDSLWDRYRTLPEREIRQKLAQVLFGPDDINKTVAQLSGGQRARLLLIILAMEKNNYLIMDEPTNHLDIQSKEILEFALQNFEGTILFVSHDRYFINEVAQKIIIVNQKSAKIIDGNYQNYVEYMNNLNTQTEKVEISSDIKKDFQKQKEEQAKIRRIQRELAQVEKDIEHSENKIASLHEEMANPEIATDFEKMNELNQKLIEVETKLEKQNNDWEKLALKSEEFDA